MRLIDSLMRQWDGIVEASALTIHDDEHDPEGATIAFERAQVEAMLRRARVDLDDLDRAAKRILTVSTGYASAVELRSPQTGLPPAQRPGRA